MTEQIPHSLDNGCPDLDIRELYLYAVIVGPIEENHGWGSGAYQCAVDPEPEEAGICSANWDGFIGDYHINADGRLALRNYFYPFTEQKPTQVDEELSGDFFLVLKPTFGAPRVYVPFLDGKVVAEVSEWSFEDRNAYEVHRGIVALKDAVRDGDLETVNRAFGSWEISDLPDGVHLDDLVVLACEGGHRGVLDSLVERGASIGRRALPTSLTNGKRDLCRHLIGSGLVELDERMPGGTTPLHHSIEKGYADVAVSLLLAGASVLDMSEREHEKLALLLDENAAIIGSLAEDETTAQDMLCVLAKEAYRTALAAESQQAKRRATRRADALFSLARRFGPLRGVSRDYSKKARNKLNGIG